MYLCFYKSLTCCDQWLVVREQTPFVMYLQHINSTIHVALFGFRDIGYKLLFRELCSFGFDSIFRNVSHKKQLYYYYYED